MKVSPLHRAFLASGQIDSQIVHTGQHYDERMSKVFFEQLELPKPDHYLGIGGGSHSYQKANVMLRFEQVLKEEKPDLVLVVGDVNATAAATIVAVKEGIEVAHVEAGLRSGDRSMPEEINRIITDSICQYHFVTEHSGLVNLARENTRSKGIHLVGNVMIDSLMHYQKEARKLSLVADLELKPEQYILMTMHRPHNVDQIDGLRSFLTILEGGTKRLPIVLPLHPRTKQRLEAHKLLDRIHQIDQLTILEPQGYLEFIHLMENARLIITDSGGIQEETTYLGVPCITFRDSTERPITVELGTNILMAELDPAKTLAQVDSILDNRFKSGVIPPLWDGQAAERITQILVAELSRRS